VSEQPLPDLPGLARWGDELRAATERVERTPARRGGRPRRRGLAVIAVVVALLALVVELGRTLASHA
jgi:hypothetical protein